MVTNIDIVTLQPIVALIFGILILFLPRILNFLVALYLIIVGVIGLFPHIMHGSLHWVH
jgi:hypothetical protein